jgi:hypothetical protein
MKDIARQLREILESAKPRLLALSEREASEKPYGEKWSLKELLGHLVDSASTNHQRIVRMQQVPDLGKFGYEQEHWVRSQCYQEEAWGDIVWVWYYYNKHLAHVIDHVNDAALGNVCDMDYPRPATLEFVIKDYIKHMQHHLGQIFSGSDARSRNKWKAVQ